VGIRSGTEEPPYKTIDHAGQVEIREYPVRLAAAVTVPGDEIAARSTGFRRLAGFIFGGNTTNTSISMTAPVAQSSAKIAMTVPVTQSGSAAGWTIMFYMPAKYTAATLPKPNDPGIKIIEAPAQTVAIYRFSGIPGRDATQKAQAVLTAQLANANWVADGAMFEWFYDPPWTLPFARRNEVGVPVALRGG
jgi:hypothetical protein